MKLLVETTAEAVEQTYSFAHVSAHVHACKLPTPFRSITLICFPHPSSRAVRPPVAMMYSKIQGPPTDLISKLEKSRLGHVYACTLLPSWYGLTFWCGSSSLPRNTILQHYFSSYSASVLSPSRPSVAVRCSYPVGLGEGRAARSCPDWTE